MNKPGKHKRLPLLMVLFLLGLVLALAAQRVVQRLEPLSVRQAPPLAVEVVDLQPGPFVLTRHYTGSLAAARTVELGARINSRVVAVHHREGEQVQKGELLISLDNGEQRNEIERLEAQGRRLRAELAYWQSQYQRSSQLLQQQAVSERVYEEALRMRDSLGASVEENAKALANARLKLEYTRIRAPFDGRVERVLTEEGGMVQAYGRALMVLASSGAMKAVVAVPQADLDWIRPGLAVRLRLPALGLSRQSRIHRLYPALDPATRNARFEAWLGDGDEGGLGLYAGMAVEAQVVVEAHDAALAVPRRALRESGPGHGVYLAVDGRARWRQVQTGGHAGGRVLIRGGLKPGERVIVTPDPRLRDGVAIQALEAVP